LTLTLKVILKKIMNPEELITKYLDHYVWRYADTNAKRSTILTFKTGAVIFNEKTKSVESTGTSHIPLNFRYDDSDHAKRSIHAEDDALDKIRHFNDKSNLSILVYTLNANMTGHVGSSRPCQGCAERLVRANLSRVYYIERDNSGVWCLNRTTPAILIGRSF